MNHENDVQNAGVYGRANANEVDQDNLATAHLQPPSLQLKAGKDGVENEESGKEEKTTQLKYDGGDLPPDDGASQHTNNTGLPDQLKNGIEAMSGFSLDDVKVHRNSNKPAQLQAHAYAQGSDIHLGPGQEKHLPHEAWHVVQQKQGRVQPTVQKKGQFNVNDDVSLEKEADEMGAKASASNSSPVPIKSNSSNSSSTMQLKIGAGKDNVLVIDNRTGKVYMARSTSDDTYDLYDKTGTSFKVYSVAADDDNYEIFVEGDLEEEPIGEDYQDLDFAKLGAEGDSFAGPSTEPQSQSNGEGDHYFKETGVGADRAKICLRYIAENFSADAVIPRETLVESLDSGTDLGLDKIKKAILFLRKNDQLFPAFPGPKLNGVSNFSRDKTALPEEEEKVVDKSLTDKIKAIITAEHIAGHNLHDKVRNALIAVIVHEEDGGTWDAYRTELIALFKIPAAGKYYTDTYVRAGDEHEQLITSMTADQVLYDLEHKSSLPSPGGELVTHLDYQRETNIETHYIMLKSVTKHSDDDDKVSQNHHPTSKDLISFVDRLDDEKLHGSPGSGEGSSPSYHMKLKAVIEKQFGLSRLNEELVAVNKQHLAGRFDILKHPASSRVHQKFVKTTGQELFFDNEEDLHKIARNVEVRRRKVLGLFYNVKVLLGDEGEYLDSGEVIDREADSDDEGDGLPATPAKYDRKDQ